MHRIKRLAKADAALTSPQMYVHVRIMANKCTFTERPRFVDSEAKQMVGSWKLCGWPHTWLARTILAGEENVSGVRPSRLYSSPVSKCQFKIYYVVQPRVQKNHSRDSDRWAVYPLEVAELVSKENIKATGA